MARDQRRLAAVRLVCALAGATLCIVASPCAAVAPVLPAANSLVTLDGIPLGTAVAARSSYPTLLYDPGKATYHLWVEVADETPPGATGPDFYPLRIAGFRHATSTDGVTFSTTGALSFAGNPFVATIFGSAYGEPPWIYPKAALWNGRYTLLLWTINGFFGPPSLGDYNYDISVSDIGPTPDNLALDHYGPLGPVPANGIAGQSAGAFGIVAGVIYYDNNSLLGRSALTDNGPQAFPATAGTGPWRATGSNAAVADPLTPLGFVACQFVNGDAYVHNDARVIANGDGTLGFFYTLRNCDGSRKSQQIYYMESADNGLTWSAPASIVSGAVTIAGQPPAGGFALSDVVLVHGKRVVYFNYPVASGDLIVGALPPVPVHRLPVPVNSPLLLAMLLVAMMVPAAFALTRTRRPR
jgi:hypothetical protein